MTLILQPEVLPSPTEVLAKQTGNCFDFVTLLCSLLLGAGYDAYCVCGYASREVIITKFARFSLLSGGLSGFLSFIFHLPEPAIVT